MGLQWHTPDFGQGFPSDPNVTKGVFGLFGNHLIEEVLKEEHAFDNRVNDCAVPQ